MSASARLTPTTFYREIDRNRRRSWLLVVVVIVVLGLLGGAVGYATGFGWGGARAGRGHRGRDEHRFAGSRATRS